MSQAGNHRRREAGKKQKEEKNTKEKRRVEEKKRRERRSNRSRSRSLSQVQQQCSRRVSGCDGTSSDRRSQRVSRATIAGPLPRDEFDGCCYCCMCVCECVCRSIPSIVDAGSSLYAGGGMRGDRGREKEYQKQQPMRSR